jgi:L-ascorbate oxidase
MLAIVLQVFALALTWTCKVGANSPSPQSKPDYVLVATAADITINCQHRYSVIFNGTSPGPPLYMREGSTTWVRVYNNIEDQNLTVVCQSMHRIRCL